ncbi:MAG TPA: WD40 repeat domain-containing protein [Gemmataceae bacterium]|nr:WD40 repeat domain-containing protein [Gemmataceae bacterium]
MLHSYHGRNWLAFASALTFSPDGSRLAAIEESWVHLWKTEATQEAPEFPLRDGRFQSLRFSGDGQVLTGIASWGVRRWSATTGKSVELVPMPTTQDRIALSPDGTILAGSTTPGTIRLWDIKNRRDWLVAAKQLLPLRSARFVESGVVASQRKDGTVIFWNLSDGRLLRQHSLPTDKYRHALLSPNGRVLAVSDYGNEIALYAIASGKELRRLVSRAEYEVRLVFSPDGTRLITTGDERGLLLWDVPTGRLLRALNGTHAGYQIVFAPEGRTIAWEEGSGVCLTEVASGKVRQNLKGPPHPEGAESAAPNRICFSRDGRFLATFARNHVVVHSLDLRLMHFHQHYPDRGGYARSAVGALSPNGRWLAHGNQGSPEILLHDLENLMAGAEPRLLKGQAGGIAHLEFSADGKHLVSASADGTALVWDMLSIGAIAQLPPAGAEGVAVLWAQLASPDAAKAGRAVMDLVKLPVLTVPLLKAKLRPVAAVPPERIAKLIADLDNKALAVRQKATTTLEQLRELVEPALREALTKKPSLELATRLDNLLKTIDGPETDPERLRSLRAVEVLERIASPEACQVLAGLATGAPAAQLTRETRASLERLAVPK